MKALVTRKQLPSRDTSPRQARRLEKHLDAWHRKPALRLVYGDYHRLLLEALPAGRILEIGSGIGHFRDASSCDRAVTSLDITPFRGLDLVADAQQLPFQAASFRGLVLLDVLHHLERPIRFLREAARVLQPGGRVVMIEPGVSLLSGLFYRLLHEEPVDMSVDPFDDSPPSSDWQPFDANQAIPTLMLQRSRVDDAIHRAEPKLRLRNWEWKSLWAYPLSGGFRSWQLIPSFLVGPLLRLERRCLPVLGRWSAFRLLIVLERCSEEHKPT